MNKTLGIAITLLTFTTACATAKKVTKPQEPSVTMSPEELTQIFQIQDDRTNAQLDQLRKDFAEVTRKIESLRNQISKQVRDCLCPGEMK